MRLFLKNINSKPYRFYNSKTIIVFVILTFTLKSCVSVKNYKFENQKTYNFEITQTNDSSDIKIIKNWFIKSFPIDKSKNQLVNYNSDTLMVLCDTKFFYPLPLPYNANYPVIFKALVVSNQTSINIRFYDYMILNYPRNSVINKQLNQDLIDNYFNDLFLKLKINFKKENELKRINR